MKKIINSIPLFLAYILKFMLSLLITNSYSMSALYIFSSALVYFLIIKGKKHITNFVCFSIIEYFFVTYIAYINYGMTSNSIFISLISFALNNAVLFGFIINDIVKLNSRKVLYFSSTQNIDSGLKALETDDYDKALEYFSKAIRDYKENYLGYMGMCNTLSKMDKKNLKKINYYKRKCIKYAPENLKKTIKERYR